MRYLTTQLFYDLAGLAVIWMALGRDDFLEVAVCLCAAPLFFIAGELKMLRTGQDEGRRR